MLQNTAEKFKSQQDQPLTVPNKPEIEADRMPAVEQIKGPIKESKPVNQTYIYRSYGGGYQGL